MDEGDKESLAKVCKFEEGLAWRNMHIGGYIEILQKCRKYPGDEFIQYSDFYKEITGVNEEFKPLLVF